MITTILIVVGVALVGAVVFGILFARKNKKIVQRGVDAANTVASTSKSIAGQVKDTVKKL